MGEVRMTVDASTDLETGVQNLPAGQYGEAVFTVGGEEIAIEVSVEEKVVVALMAGEDAVWKGTLDGLKQLLRGEIKAR